METTLFRWIHLSDIHVGHGDAEHGWDQKLVMDALRRDIAAQVKKDQAPIDAIFVTGDIAFSGAGRRDTEYVEAKAWLTGVAAEAGVKPSQIFVVPGNHDVNRAADKDRNTKRLVDGLRGGRDKIDAALADRNDRALLAGRMKAYLAFAADFAPAGLEERLFWVHRREAQGGLRVRLVGLNTALLAADELDHGNLYLGREQLHLALQEPPIEEGELVMVLSHHPIQNGWLGDERDVDSWIRNRAHVHLSGHVHEAASEQARSGGGGAFVRIVAGSVHTEKGETTGHGYSFGAAVRAGNQLKVRIWPRKWSAKNASFRLDADNVPEGETFAQHDLHVKLAPALGASPSPEDLIEIFISYAPEDEAYRVKLEKHLTGLKRQNLITSWSAAEVNASEDGKQVTHAHLRSARVILLLVSADYLNSDECYDVEMQTAVERHAKGEAAVIPILLRDCNYKLAPFKSLNVVPRLVWHRDEPPVPVTKVKFKAEDKAFSSEDEAFTNVAKYIGTEVERLRKAGVGRR
jgi:predicted MPP superfamily phosphohydrolase